MRLRTDYDKALDQYTNAKAKLDEQKAKGSKRLDEYKDRFVKVGRKKWFLIFVKLSYKQFALFLDITTRPLVPSSYRQWADFSDPALAHFTHP